MSTKKAGGTVFNGRDSQAKRLGIKLFGGEATPAGGILVRQKGNKYFAGKNVSQGKDFTLYAKVSGVVSFHEKKRKRYDGSTRLATFVNIEPMAVVAA